MTEPYYMPPHDVRRKLLQSPSERLRLLQEVPKVIAEELEVEPTSVELPEDDKPINESNDDSPRSILTRASETLDDVAGKRTSSNLKDGGRKPAGDGAVYDQKSEKLESEGRDAMSMSVALEIFTPNLAGDEHGNGEAVNERVAEKAEGQDVMRVQTASAIVISDLAGDEDRNGEAVNERAIEKVEAFVTRDQQQHSHVSVPEQQQEKSDVVVQGDQHHSKLNVSEEQHQQIEVVDEQKNREINNLNENKEDQEKVDQRSIIEVIELDDDDEEDEDQFGSRILENPESAIWHYVDPFGDIQGPYSMNMLKQWREANYFGPDFKVWKTGQTQEAAILLTDAMAQVFPHNR
ncbi:GYF [Macleaya cordata]|uniref:GYF n=1 Tax=Macleaya cordata TaxID=56857 RepID=A0A200QMF8_MACCD|nr:GYF [Macleaya cordata]